MQSYVGPYKIVDRPGHSTIRVKVGTFKNGAENVQLHHWANAKPASLRADFEEATMPTRGRPPKKSKPDSPQPVSEVPKLDTPTQSDVQNATGSGAAKNQTTRKTRSEVNNAPPVRRSERIQKQSHATSSTELQHLPWSANAREIQTLNQAIHRNSVSAG